MSNDNDNNKDFIDMRDQASKEAIPPEQQAPTPAPAGSGGPPKKSGKIPGWAIALIFLGIGLAVGLSNFNFNFGFGGIRNLAIGQQTNNSELTTLTTLAASQVNHIDVHLGVDNINVETHNSNYIRIVYNPPRTGNYNIPLYNFNEITGELRIFTEPNLVIIGHVRTGSGLDIYLPEDIDLQNFSLRTSTGNIDISRQNIESNLADNVSLNSTTGRIGARHIFAGSFSATSTTGRIELNNIETSNNFFASSTTGRIEGRNITAGSNMTVSATTGRIDLGNIHAYGNGDFRSTTGGIVLSSNGDFNNVTINASTGRIDVSDFSANSMDIRSTTGNIDVRQVSLASDFRASASTGRIDAIGIEANVLGFTTTTGNISLNNSRAISNAGFQASTGRVNVGNTEINGILAIHTTTGNINLTGVDTDMDRANIITNRNANISIN